MDPHQLHAENLRLKRQLQLQDDQIKSHKTQRLGLISTTFAAPSRHSTTMDSTAVSEIDSVKQALINEKQAHAATKVNLRKLTVAFDDRRTQYQRDIEIYKEELAKLGGHTNKDKRPHDDAADGDENRGSVSKRAKTRSNNDTMIDSSAEDEDSDRSVWQDSSSEDEEDESDDDNDDQQCSDTGHMDNADDFKDYKEEMPSPSAQALASYIDLTEENEADALQSQFKAASLEPRSVRQPRKARVAGEKTRKRLQKETPQWVFKCIQGRPYSRRPIDPSRCKDKTLWLKITRATEDWEKEMGAVWFTDHGVFREDPTRRPFCVDSKIKGPGKTTWRRGDAGEYACERCSTMKKPCFAFLPATGRFVLLPLHPGDRSHQVTEELDIHHWINT